MRPTVKLYPEVERLSTKLRVEVLPFWTQQIDDLDPDDPLRHKMESVRDVVLQLTYDGEEFMGDYEAAFHGDRRIDMRPKQLKAWLGAAQGIEIRSEHMATAMLDFIDDAS